MTDKQIIIDGVDVSGCVHLYREIDCLAHMDYSECCEGYDPSYGYCPKTDCYYKQLKRAEQRIVELNKTIQAKEQECERWKENNAQFIKDNQFLSERNSKLKAANERLKKGIFKLDKTQPQVILTEGQVSLMYCTFLDMELKTTKLKQTLQEIKAICKSVCGNGLDEEVDKFGDIIDKINEVEDEEV